MPFQLVNDSPIEVSVGPQMMARSRRSAIPRKATRITQSRVLNWRNRRNRGPRPPLRGGWVCGAAGSARVAGIVTTTLSLRREDRPLLRLDVLEDAVDVVGVTDELLDRRDHYILREVRAGVAVHELRDVLGAAAHLDGLLLQRVVGGGVGVLVAGHVARVGLEEGV